MLFTFVYHHLGLVVVVVDCCFCWLYFTLYFYLLLHRKDVKIGGAAQKME